MSDPTRDRDASSESEARPRRPGAPGFRILIPGCPQWAMDQRERALILFGSYAASLVVGMFAWGSTVGIGVLAFAFLAHAFSAADAIGQSAFPAFGRFVPGLTASAGLGAFCYVPALALASGYAWPITLDENPRDGYLINRWAYRDALPEPGQTIWLRPSRGARPRVACIVAGPGQEVEWADNRFRVDDQVTDQSPFRALNSPGGLRLKIPERHVLVTFGADPSKAQGVPGGWEIVDREDVRGRAWARSYPIWSRTLLR